MTGGSTWINLNRMEFSHVIFGNHSFDDHSFDGFTSASEHRVLGGSQFSSRVMRVLKPGGILRLAVPNLEDIARDYLGIIDGLENGSDLKAEHHGSF